MATIKFGVVGTIRGITFIELLQTMGDRACLHAVCENDADKAKEIKEKLPEGVAVYANYDELLDSGIDAVVLTNFFHEHSDYAIKALEKGIHVISDTTAAPTLGDCVKLCRAAEKSTAKYMLGANGPYKKALQFMKKQIAAGKLGDVFYAEAEYLHYAGTIKPYADDSTHWRRMMPGTYYNMHTLGSLMYVTGLMPKQVTATVVRVGDRAKQKNMLTDHSGAKILCRMDNGATLDVTGCAGYGPTSKWFRLIGEKGVLETKRYDETQVLFANANDHFFPDEEIPEIEVYKPQYAELDMVSKEEYADFTEEQMKLGHGGIDFWMLLYFIKYIKGEYEPFFNVYRATALSAAAILSWRSVLDNSRTYTIPDFSNEEERKLYENDFLSPFATEESGNLIPRVAP
ncbi:MAG: Gfo/Idh/MocA family oxidoreductase [Ruminococcaceae bacterium]|nr:Gfo/Idh/MocA family oxidoreductase [Oscillospiraceae bacterium]